jgi:hypothetical protein
MIGGLDVFLRASDLAEVARTMKHDSRDQNVVFHQPTDLFHHDISFPPTSCLLVKMSFYQMVLPFIPMCLIAGVICPVGHE